MVEFTIPLVLDIIRTIGILVGIVYYITIMRNQQKTRELTLESQELTRKAYEQASETRETQLFMQIYQQLNSVESMATWAEVMSFEVGSFEDFLERHDSSVNPESFGKRGHLWWSYNTIGALVANGLIDVRLVAMLLGPMILAQWEKWEEIIRGTREREGILGQWAGFELLYNELVKVRDQEGWSTLFFR